MGVFSVGTKGCAPDLRSHDEGGSFAAGRARKSLSLSSSFRNSSMEKPAATDMLQDSVVRPIKGVPARRTYFTTVPRRLLVAPLLLIWWARSTP
jgi:hypothetical protein